MSIQTIITSLTPYHPQKIILFGSRVRGAADSSSDYDIAIIKDTDEPYHDRVIAARRLIRSTTPIDLFVFTSKELKEKKLTNPLVAEIVSSGKVVYES
ncbi:nucleotidyltransferase domain-containing protein [Patescibacteria group bacterium]|nr:nucleotidyltransferase domain-containing protein [Patescibacteria group bacterium]MBU1472601.1 nucleotidyltransferase domain-containing protein [Patescibacteria group bacterium]MBU2459852.1 nucleotidyltransferase domain-containing protein [Patescibacteria group bacterium]MBU2544087.1 nucleotidyltransferase domain-containing protein [Patescibacteria group bacterium]